MSNASRDSLPVAPPGVPPGGTNGKRQEHPTVSVARLLVTSGGVVALALTGLLPAVYAAGALVFIAVPTSAGALRDVLAFFRGEGKP